MSQTSRVVLVLFICSYNTKRNKYFITVLRTGAWLRFSLLSTVALWVIVFIAMTLRPFMDCAVFLFLAQASPQSFILINLTAYLTPVCFWFFFFWPCITAFGILVPQPGIEPVPLHWKHGLVTIGPQGSPLAPAFWNLRAIPLLACPLWTWFPPITPSFLSSVFLKSCLAH